MSLKPKMKFTIYYGFAASLAIHLAVVMPFIVQALAEPPEEPLPVVLELQSVVAEVQTEQKVLQETKGEVTQEDKPAKTDETVTAQQTPPPQEEQTEAAEDNGTLPPPTPPQPTPPTPQPKPEEAKPVAEPKAGSAGANDVKGVEEQQNAQTIKTDPEEVNRLKEYVKRLTKKVQAKLVYPDEGRSAGLHGTATVSFAILGDGQIRPETLRIIESSGQSKLDASALKTIRASIPFAPPPEEMTVAIAVVFGRK